jgi:hypothetical protein
MAILGKMTVEDLKALGLDPADITAIKSGLVSEDKIKQLIAESNTNTMAEMQKMFTDLETKLRPQSGNKDGNNNNNGDDINNGNNGGGDNTNDLTDYMADPIAATKKLIADGTKNIAAHSMQIAADMAYENAARSLPHFKIQAIADEVKTEWDKYPIQVKGNPAVLIRNIYDMVVGRHLEEIRIDTDKKDGKYNLFQSGGANRVTDNSIPSKKPEDLLTPEEEKAAAAFGLTKEDYAKQKGTMRFV